MVLSKLWTGMICVSILFSMLHGNGAKLAAAVSTGAQSAISLMVSMAGSLCLWSGAGALMEKTGITALLARLLSPVIRRLFPSSATDPKLANALSGNICSNLLGLGNAATPMGIAAVKRLTDPRQPNCATDEMCRLVVLNTASIQLIPTTVAAVRSGLGCDTPFDILPAVWITSLCSAGIGLLFAVILGRLHHDR